MTRSHWRIFCYLPGVKKIPCTCIQPYVYHSVWHVYAALSFSNVLHQLKLCSPLKAQFQCHLYRKPSGIYWNETSADSLYTLWARSFFSFLDLAPNRPSLEFHPLSRLSCSNLLTLKQTGSLFGICIRSLYARGKRRAVITSNLMEKQIKFLALGAGEIMNLPSPANKGLTP